MASGAATVADVVSGLDDLDGAQAADLEARRGAQAAAPPANRRRRRAGCAKRRGRAAAARAEQDAQQDVIIAGLVGGGSGGLTPLVFAAREGDIECGAGCCSTAGADVNQTTEYGWTPLLVATNNRNYKLGAYSSSAARIRTSPNKGGWTPLYLATDNRNIEGGDYPVPKPDMDHLEYIKLLLKHGANPNSAGQGKHAEPHDLHDAVVLRSPAPLRSCGRRSRATSS